MWGCGGCGGERRGAVEPGCPRVGGEVLGAGVGVEGLHDVGDEGLVVLRQSGEQACEHIWVLGRHVVPLGGV